MSPSGRRKAHKLRIWWFSQHSQQEAQGRRRDRYAHTVHLTVIQQLQSMSNAICLPFESLSVELTLQMYCVGQTL